MNIKFPLVALALALPLMAWAEVGILSLYPGIGSAAHYKHGQRFGGPEFPTYTVQAVHEPQPPDYVGIESLSGTWAYVQARDFVALGM